MIYFFLGFFVGAAFQTAAWATVLSGEKNGSDMDEYDHDDGGLITGWA